MALIDELEELFWQMKTLNQIDDREFFKNKAKIVLRNIILKIRGGEPV